MNTEGIDLVQNCQNTEPTITYSGPKRGKQFIWRDAELITFLEVFKNHPCLYDMTLPTRISRTSRSHGAIKEIATLEMLNALKEKIKRPELLKMLTADKVFKKTTEIKYNFCRAWNKVKNSNGQYKPSYVWYDLAESFLEPYAMYSLNRRNCLEAARHGKQWAEPANAYSRKRKASEKATESDTNNQKTTSGFTYFDVRTQKDDRFAKFGTSVAENLRKMALPEALALFQGMQSLINKRRVALRQTEENEGTIEQKVRAPSIKSDNEEDLVPNVMKQDNISQQTKIEVQPARVLKVQLEDIMQNNAAYGLRKKSNN